MHVIFNACLFAYSILQITQLKGALSGIVNGPEAYNKIFPLLVTSCVVLAVFTLLFAWLSFKLYLEFGWEIFKRIGASPVMHRTCAIERAEWRRRAGREQKGGQALAPGMLNKKVARHTPAPTTAPSNHPDRRAPLLLPSSSTEMYKAYLVFLMLLKLDFYFFEVFAIQFLVLVLQTADPEYGLTIAIIILALPIVIYAMYCVRNPAIACAVRRRAGSGLGLI